MNPKPNLGDLTPNTPFLHTALNVHDFIKTYCPIRFKDVDNEKSRKTEVLRKINELIFDS